MKDDSTLDEMVQIHKLDHLEYKEAILDSPEFREKLKRHEKHIVDTSKNIKLLLKKFEDVISASEALRNAQDAFSVCLKEFHIGFVGDTNEEESDIVDTLECTYTLFQDVKEFSTKMINTGHMLIKQLDSFRKDRLEQLKEKKKEYERQTVKYCAALEKYLQSQYSSKRERNSEDSTDSKETDKLVREENQLFYQKCLDYVLCIQEFEEKWFHFFSESIFAFVQSCTTFYHEGYEKHYDTDAKYTKSHGGIQALANNFEYFKSRSKELINDILKDPDYFINSFQSLSLDHNLYTSKQGYLYLLEKKALGSSARVKQFCKYYKEIKKFEVIPFSQTANKVHQPEVYTVLNCQKSSLEKRFVFDLTLRDKGSTYVNTYQALSYDDYKAWFAIMEGKELTPVSTAYSSKTDPIYILDRNGINFIKKCIQLLEDEKINEEGIYRKNGVSHKINQFIEKNFPSLNSLVSASSTTNGSDSLSNNGVAVSSSSSPAVSLTNSANNEQQIIHPSGSTSFISNVLKSAANNIPLLSNSPSFSALNFLSNSSSSSSSNTHKFNNNTNNDLTDSSFTTPTVATTTTTSNQANNIQCSSSSGVGNNSSLSTSSASSSASPSPNQQTSTTTPQPSPLNSQQQQQQQVSFNIIDSFDDTCTITSALKHYLIHLKEPLMTYANNQQFLMACRQENLIDRVSEIHKLLHSLPPSNVEALELLMRHLNKISTHSHQNKMTTSNLATCFGPTVFRTEQESVSNLYNIKFYSEIVELLITHCDEMFKPSLEAKFLQSITPLKTPPTMLSGNMQHINQKPMQNNTNSSPNTNWSSTNNNQSLTPSSSNNKIRMLNSSSSNTAQNKQNDQNYRNTTNNNSMLNSSKTSVSSDSSTSDKDLREFTGNNSNLASPLSSSSPNNHHHSTSNTSMNNSSIHYQKNGRSSTTTSGFVTSPLTNTARPAKNGHYNPSYQSNPQQQQQQDQSAAINMHKLAIANSLNNNTNQSTTSTNATNRPASVSLVSLPIHATNSINLSANSGSKSVNTSPSNSRLSNIVGGHQSSSSVTGGGGVASSSTAASSSSSQVGQPASGSSTASLNSSFNYLTNLTLVNLEHLSNSNKPRRARTLFPCEADNPSELSFEANVIISNVRRSKESGWLEATYNGKSGLVPGNYVQILDD